LFGVGAAATKAERERVVNGAVDLFLARYGVKSSA
jgi:AefR-like transcriptional repressor, C-terminal domain